MFPVSDITHVFETVDPVRDLEVVETELILADLEVRERAMAKRQKDWQTKPADHAAEQRRMTEWKACLESGKPLRSLDFDDADRSELKAAGLLTGKPQLLVANAASSDRELIDALRQTTPKTPLVVLDAELELELQELDAEELTEFMRELDMEASCSTA